MLKIEFSSELRRRLELLVESSPLFFDCIINLGCETAFVNESWIDLHCSEDDKRLHKEISVELAREYLLLEEPEKIIFSDEPVEQSKLLRRLKKQRILQYGTAEQLSVSDDMSHLVYLDPCVQRMLEESANSSVWRSQEFRKRRLEELAMFHRDNPHPVAALSKATKPQLFAYLLQQLAASLHFENVEWVTLYEDLKLESYTIVETGFEENLVIWPILELDESVAPNGEYGGTLLIAVKAIQNDQCDSLTYNKLAYDLRPIRYTAIFPSQFSGMGRFETHTEFAYLCSIWTSVVSLTVQTLLANK